MEQWTGSKLGKEYVKIVYCHLAYLTYMQSISCLFNLYAEYIMRNVGLEKAQAGVKMGTIKDRNDMDLAEAEDIKKRWKNT